LPESCHCEPQERLQVKANLPGGSISRYANRAGSLHALARFGDERNALLTLTVRRRVWRG
jgi:hypothetical protein